MCETDHTTGHRARLTEGTIVTGVLALAFVGLFVAGLVRGGDILELVTLAMMAAIMGRLTLVAVRRPHG